MLECAVDVGQTRVHVLAEGLRRQAEILLHQLPAISIQVNLIIPATTLLHTTECIHTLNNLL